MKTKEQIAKENDILDINDIFTLDEFEDAIDCGGINRNDGGRLFS